MKKAKKIGLIILLSIIGLIVWQFLSYYLYAGFAKVMTINHFGPSLVGQYYSFVCVSDYTSKELDDYQKFCVRLSFSPSSRKVYFGLNNVPSDLKYEYKDRKTGKMRFSEFKNGYLLSLFNLDTGYMWYRSSYFHQEGMMGGGGCDAVFVWVLGGWWLYKTEGGIII
jgi:hypothetical protein